MRMPVDEFRRLPECRREEILQLVRAHGFDPLECFDIECSVMDAPMLTVWVYDRNDEGKLFLRHPDDKEAAYHTVDVLLRHPLPEWWRDE